MKNPLSHFLLASLLAGGLGATSVWADPSSTVDLSTVVIKNGSSISVEGSPTIDAATSYTYVISGTCHGTGDLAFISNGTSIVDAMNSIGASQFVNDLSGEVDNPDGTLPLVVVKSKIDGSFSFGPFSGSANANVSVKIDEAGVISFNTSKVSVTLNGAPNNSSIVFEAGSTCVVNAVPDDGYQTDVTILDKNGNTVGDNVYSSGQTVKRNVKAGTSGDLNFTVQNDGTNTDDITVVGSKAKPGFKLTYLVGPTDVTAEILAGKTFSGISAGGSVEIVAHVDVKNSATSGTVQSVKLSSTSGLGSGSDQANYQLKVK